MKKRHIAIILDQSGSMQTIRSDAEGGLLAFIDEQRRLPGNTTVSLYPFNSTMEVAFEYRPLEEVSGFQLQPFGGTALLDAVGASILRMRKHFNEMPEGDQPDEVIVVILTDGLENASREYSLKRVKKRITRQREHYGWTFVFLGANQDAFQAAGGMGIDPNTTLSHSTEDTQVSMRRAGSMVARGTETGSFAFTREERDATR
ncbi:VWA domain-containing protein (plasmid) [Streptosporangium sp. NBC_01495]|uniref:vWA domain-containing protein n=1 Tax=Streptosporangium sp. NBC_01495 TaxID=2903899 RepID=UPI002E33F7F5|nr:vWA domain-containing protein [Streptosporangium sp. NBC_01495]